MIMKQRRDRSENKKREREGGRARETNRVAIRVNEFALQRITGASKSTERERGRRRTRKREGKRNETE
jgi:hypothetical protein